MKLTPSVFGLLLLAAGVAAEPPDAAPRAAAAVASVAVHQGAVAKKKAPATNPPAPANPANQKPLIPLDDPLIKNFEVPAFGPIYVYLPKQMDDETDVVLFASGDGGWDQGFIDMVVRIQAAGKIVVGFSTPEFLKRLDASKLKCAYPPQELEALSQFIQRKLGITSYRIPMLVGYSSGASLVYVAAAQTPINAFAGAISLGFCAELALEKPLCRQGSLKKTPVKNKPEDPVVRLYPIEELVAPLEVLHGQNDELCKIDDIVAFMKMTGNATLTSLPKVGHGFAVTGEWFPQFMAAFEALEAKRPVEPPPSSEAMAGLPLIERPIQRPIDGGGSAFVVMLSGDGGWSTLTEKVTNELNAKGFPVVGWNMLKYFWTAKTPENASADLAAIISHYATVWNEPEVILAGYSMGADVLPALVNRLPIAEQQRVRSIVLMAPERATDFEFHLSGWLKHVPEDASPIAPEVGNLPDGVRMTCVYGNEEADRSLCTQIDSSNPTLTIKELPGSHHFDGNYEALADLIR